MNGPSIEKLGIFGYFESILFPRNQVFALLSKHLVIPAHIKSISSIIDAGKAAGSLRENTFLEESLYIVILGIIDILGSKPMFFSLVFPEKDKATVSGKIFLEIKEVETLLEEYLAI